MKYSRQMSYDGRDIANYILDYCESENIKVTNLKLQKLVYFCHVFYLVHYNTPLVKHEFEAWEHGPVLSYLYKAFKEFEKSPITTRAKYLDLNTGHMIDKKHKLSEDIKKFLFENISFYARLTSYQLVELSHVEEGPWHQVWHSDKIVNLGMKISNSAILNFYKNNKPSSIVLH